MTFSVSYVTEADMPEVINVKFDTFGHTEPAVNAFMPNSDTPKGRADIVARQLAINKHSPMAHHMKITEDTTGKIAGQATWFMSERGMRHSEADLEGPWWESEEELEWARDMWRVYFGRRWGVFRECEGPVFAISSMSVLPEYSGRGAGSAFIAWGLERADHCGAECVVESTTVAEGFYAKHGFVAQERVNLADEMPEKWKGRPEQVYVWMSRPARKCM